MKPSVTDKEKKLAVIGGDLRQLVAARKLKTHGLLPVIYGFDASLKGEDLSRAPTLADALRDASMVLLPLPYSYDGVRLNAPFSTEEIFVSEVLEKAEGAALLLAGRVPPTLDGRLVDYYAREEFSVWNAIPTAEGTLALVMDEMPITVHGMRVGVVGFGRIGRTTASLFRAAGAETTVFARRYGALAEAETCGCRPRLLSELIERAPLFDCLINTVPALIFGREVLARMNPKTLLVDLASKPGGVDFDAARAIGIHAVEALSLPGKTSPDTAGHILAQTILNIMRERDAAGAAPALKREETP